MNMSVYTQFARFLRSWADVPDAEITKAVAIFQPASVAKETIFLHAGEIPQTISFIISGASGRAWRG
jgi:hypothetical protein